MSIIEKALNKHGVNRTEEKREAELKQNDAVSTKKNTHQPLENTGAVSSDTADYSEKKFLELDLEFFKQSGMVTANKERTQVNEEYRAIKRKILSNAFGQLSGTLAKSNIIMVTSSKPGEGKTFTAVNLALSIALEQNKTVLLVDADVLRPNVMRTLGQHNQTGLIEYLLGEESSFSDILLHTNLDKLRILPAGRAHHLSNELLASQKMNDLMDELATRYNDRVIIVDTPPLLGINETALLANLAGQAVVVVEEGRTKIHDLKKAVEQLNPEMAIGYVVNKTKNEMNKAGYYGYYYKREDEKVEEEK